MFCLYCLFCWLSSYVLLFFSSRRRHTRCGISDWSSDVCSSDLLGMDGGDDPGMSVAGVRDRDAGAEIEVAGAVDVPDPRALGVVGHHWEVRREHRRDDGVVEIGRAHV